MLKWLNMKQLPPPPRKVVIERLPPLPSKPQPLIVERWLPYRPSCKRRVIFQTAPPDPVVIKPRNVTFITLFILKPYFFLFQFIDRF